VSDLTTPIDVAFDATGVMFVLEFAADYTPGSGRLLRRSGRTALEVMLDGLNFPTGLAADPAGGVYISEISGPAGGETGSGRLLHIATQRQG
jgi:hypothetical protein